MTSRRAAFTLNELLIVIAIIVLMIAVALPAFNALSGSRSIASAQNQVSAYLGQARVEAIGVQETRGVMFFYDPATARVHMAMVRDSQYDNGDGVTYLDLVPDRDIVALPTGILLQTIDSAAVNAGNARQDDGYIGYNISAASGGGPVTPDSTIITPYGGVILFDSYGKLLSVKYGFRCSQNSASQTGTYTAMASLLAKGDVNSVGLALSSAKDFIPSAVANPANPMFSQLGLVLFDAQGFTSQSFTATDIQIAGGTYGTVSTPYASPPSEADEEDWIDKNGTLLLVNRYNGTLVKGE
jgi:type II secretory pathway pseudopilin PulG